MNSSITEASDVRTPSLRSNGIYEHHDNHDPLGLPPTSLHDLVARIRAENVACTCDTHDVASYGQCIRRHQELISMDPQTQVQTVASPKVFANQKFDALHLARAAIAYFSKPEGEMNTTQKEALAAFRRTSLSRFGWQDGPRALAKPRVEEMLRIFSRLFFLDAINVMFTWKDLSSRLADCGRTLGRCWPDGRIELDPLFVGSHVGAADYKKRIQARLKTLLHEATHAFFFRFACRECPMFVVNLENANGHGRAFQMLTAALWDASERLLGLPLRGNGFNDFNANWSGVRYLPSVHDLHAWRWLPKSEHDGDGGEKEGPEEAMPEDVGRQQTSLKRLADYISSLIWK